MMETIIGSSFLKYIPYSSYHHTYIRRVKINLKSWPSRRDGNHMNFVYVECDILTKIQMFGYKCRVKLILILNTGITRSDKE